MPRLLRLLLALFCATLVLVSCGTDETATDPPSTGEETVSESAGPHSAPSGSPTTREAVADLARRLDVAEGDVTVEGAEAVTWRDGSLGCAEKGMMYTQALVEGSRITLRVDEQTFEYHAGGPRAPFLCDNPTQ